MEAALELTEQRKNVHVHQLIGDHGKQSQADHRQALLVHIDSLKFLLRQGLCIKGHEEMEGNLMQLLQLCSKDLP